MQPRSLGGRLAEAGPSLVASIERRIAQDAFAAAEGVTVVPGTLGRAGGALGAAALVVRSSEWSQRPATMR